MGLIVDKRSLYFLSFHGAELASYNCVPKSNSCGQNRHESSAVRDQVTDNHHRGVKHSEITLKRKFALLCHIAETHQHIGSRDAYLVENSPAIILSGIANFSTEVSSLNSWQMFVSLQISQLYHEWLDTIVFIINDQSSVDHGV